MDFTGEYLRGYSGDPAASLGAALGNIVAPALQGMEQGKADRKQRLTDQADKLGQAIKFALASKDEAGAAAYAKDLQGIMRQLHGDNAFFNQSFATLAGSPTVKSAAALVAPSAPSAAASPAGVPAAAPAGAPAASPVLLNVPAALPPMQLFPPSPYGLDGVLSSGRGPLTLGYGGKASFDNPLAGMGQSQPEVTIPQLPGGNPLRLATAEAPAVQPEESPAAAEPQSVMEVLAAKAKQLEAQQAAKEAPAAAPAVPAAAQPAPTGAAPFAAMMAPKNPETAGTPSIDMNYVRALARMAHADPKYQEVPAYGTLIDPETGTVIATGGTKPQDLAHANYWNFLPNFREGQLAFQKDKADKDRFVKERGLSIREKVADSQVTRNDAQASRAASAPAGRGRSGGGGRPAGGGGGRSGGGRTSRPPVTYGDLQQMPDGSVWQQGSNGAWRVLSQPSRTSHDALTGAKPAIQAPKPQPKPAPGKPAAPSGNLGKLVRFLNKQ